MPLTVHIHVGIAVSMGILQDIASSPDELGSQRIRTIRALKMSASLVRVRGLTIPYLRKLPTTSKVRLQEVRCREDDVSNLRIKAKSNNKGDQGNK